MTTQREYCIGGACVRMTPRQAERWNSGEDMTQHDERTVRVFKPHGGHGHWVTLRRARNERLEPDLAEMLNGSEAQERGK